MNSYTKFRNDLYLKEVSFQQAMHNSLPRTSGFLSPEPKRPRNQRQKRKGKRQNKQ